METSAAQAAPPAPQGMVLLIGEQPLANVIPVLMLQPRSVKLLYTEAVRDLTSRLQNFLTQQQYDVTAELCSSAYDIPSIQHHLQQLVDSTPLLWNVTGGTKPMVLAAADLARRRGEPLVYLVSEGQSQRLHTYRYNDRKIHTMDIQPVPEVLKIDIFLRMHAGEYRTSRQTKQTEGFAFQEKVCAILRSEKDFEVLDSVRISGISDHVDLDCIVRYRNSFAILECKTGKSAISKSVIDQLNSASKLLGRYTQQLVITDRDWHPKDHELLLALAAAYRITILPLTSWTNGQTIDRDDAEKVLLSVRTALGAGPAPGR